MIERQSKIKLDVPELSWGNILAHLLMSDLAGSGVGLRRVLRPI